ncbi:hypothetical protein AB5I41_12235 [Sphingomonas sp. MMS24-JH45]
MAGESAVRAPSAPAMTSTAPDAVSRASAAVPVATPATPRAAFPINWSSPPLGDGGGMALSSGLDVKSRGLGHAFHYLPSRAAARRARRRATGRARSVRAGDRGAAGGRFRAPDEGCRGDGHRGADAAGDPVHRQER